MAGFILSGQRKTHIPRPAGFLYPWPDAHSRSPKGEGHGRAKNTEAEVLGALQDVVSGTITTVRQFQERLGLTKTAAHKLLAGATWTDIQRPAGLADAYRKMVRFRLSSEKSALVVAELRSGRSSSDVAEEFDLSEEKMQHYCKLARGAR